MPIFLCKLWSRKVHGSNLFLVFHLVPVIVGLPYERFCAILSVSMQISQTKIENCANFSDGPVQTVWNRDSSFCNANWSKYFKKVFHVYLQKSSNVGDIKPSKNPCSRIFENTVCQNIQIQNKYYKISG